MLNFPHHIVTGIALLDRFINFIIGAFLAPGHIILRSFNDTPWGHELHLGAHWALTALVALIFWCLLFNLLDAADTQVRRFVSRNRKPDAR